MFPGPVLADHGRERSDVAGYLLSDASRKKRRVDGWADKKSEGNVCIVKDN